MMACNEASETPRVNDSDKLAPFNPTSEKTQEIALQMLQLRENDVLFDLGCGDGRLLCMAVQKAPSIRCVGLEIDPLFVQRAQESIQKIPEDVQERIQVRLENVLESSATGDLTLNDATAIYMYLLPKGLVRMKPLLEDLIQRRSPIRIVTYMFQVHGWAPKQIESTKAGMKLYLYEF